MTTPPRPPVSGYMLAASSAVDDGRRASVVRSETPMTFPSSCAAKLAAEIKPRSAGWRAARGDRRREPPRGLRVLVKQHAAAAASAVREHDDAVRADRRGHQAAQVEVGWLAVGQTPGIADHVVHVHLAHRRG